MHNTVTVDGVSSSTPAGPFKWTDPAQCTPLCWHDRESFSFFAGYHTGYRRLLDATTHTRAVLFANREYWVLLDRIDAVGAHAATLNFHLAHGVTARRDVSKQRMVASAAQSGLEILVAGAAGNWTISEDFVSPCYGAKLAATCCSYSIATSGATERMLALVPTALNQSAPAIDDIPLPRGQGMTVRVNGNRDLVLHDAPSSPQHGVLANDFEWLWLRHAASDNALQRMLLLHGMRLQMPALKLQFSRKISFCGLSLVENRLAIELSQAADVSVSARDGIAAIEINGRVFHVESNATMNVAASQVPALLVSPNISKDQECAHVRH